MCPAWPIFELSGHACLLRPLHQVCESFCKKFSNKTLAASKIIETEPKEMHPKKFFGINHFSTGKISLGFDARAVSF